MFPYEGQARTNVDLSPLKVQCHGSTLEDQGRRVFFEKLMGEIINEVKDFPPHLPLDDQGRFAIGYYHQMQFFFTKKTEQTTEKEMNNE